MNVLCPRATRAEQDLDEEPSLKKPGACDVPTLNT